MGIPLRILIVEDSPADTLLLVRALRKGGYEPVYEQVDTAEAMRAALERQEWDVVTADYAMPRFSGMAALRVLQDSGLDLPFIIVSGKIGEETAVELMRAGAHDYVMKDRLGRLGPAITRERQDALARRGHRQAQEALCRSEARYHNLFENMADAYALHEILLDAQGRPCDYRFLEVNPAFERLLGLSRQAVIGKRVLEVLPATEPCWIETFGRVALTGRAERFERYSQSFDRYFEVAATSPQHGLFAVIFNDVTKRRQAEEALRSANERLAQTLEELRVTQQQVIQSEKLAALGTLAAGVAHELNNPLMGVMGCVTFARKAAREPQVQELLDSANRELERMRDLIRSMLGFARPVVDAGTLCAVNVRTVLKGALARMQPEFKVQGISVTTEVALDLPSVAAVAEHLQQVLLNLLTNARDALEGQTCKQVRVSARRRDARVEIAVADTGPGIPAELQERIFDPFFTTKPPGKGTGLGLSIARSIMADLGGTLTCASRPGEGATFVAALPLPGDRTDEPVRRE